VRHLQEQRANRAVFTYRARKGFQSVLFLIDETTHEYGSFSVWAARADAEAAGADTRARMAAGSADYVQAAPTTRIWEIYEPQPEASNP
jgi:hypothetical protein